MPKEEKQERRFIYQKTIAVFVIGIVGLSIITKTGYGRNKFAYYPISWDDFYAKIPELVIFSLFVSLVYMIVSLRSLRKR